MQDGAIASERCSQVDFLSEGGGISRGVKRKGERRVEGRSCMGFDDNTNVGIGGMNVASGNRYQKTERREWVKPHLAKSRRDAVAEGAFRFCTRRIFLGGEDQSRDKRSWSRVSVSVSS